MTPFAPPKKKASGDMMMRIHKTTMRNANKNTMVSTVPATTNEMMSAKNAAPNSSYGPKPVSSCAKRVEASVLNVYKFCKPNMLDRKSTRLNSSHSQISY